MITSVSLIRSLLLEHSIDVQFSILPEVRLREEGKRDG